MRSAAVLAALTVVTVAALPAGDAHAGVKYGDAVAAIVKPSDHDRIRRILSLERFSIIAAVLLGATEGREMVVAEPLTDESLAAVKKGCEAKQFCPDPVGFVASRVRVVVLHDNDIAEKLTVDTEVRGRRGWLVDLEMILPRGRLLGWNGTAGSESGHVSLELTPMVLDQDGKVIAGIDPPFNFRWNEAAERFQFFDCVMEAGHVECAFEPEVAE